MLTTQRVHTYTILNSVEWHISCLKYFCMITKFDEGILNHTGSRYNAQIIKFLLI